jgi:hypothetical protein
MTMCRKSTSLVSRFRLGEGSARQPRTTSSTRAQQGDARALQAKLRTIGNTAVKDEEWAEF